MNSSQFSSLHWGWCSYNHNVDKIVVWCLYHRRFDHWVVGWRSEWSIDDIMLLVIWRRCHDPISTCPCVAISAKHERWMFGVFYSFWVLFCRLTSESARRRGELALWYFLRDTSIVKYDRVSLVCHSLRGVVKVQVFVVMDFWRGVTQ